MGHLEIVSTCFGFLSVVTYFPVLFQEIRQSAVKRSDVWPKDRRFRAACVVILVGPGVFSTSARWS